MMPRGDPRYLALEATNPCRRRQTSLLANVSYKKGKIIEWDPELIRCRSQPVERSQQGKPSAEVRASIKRTTTKPYWRALRIHGELLKVGIGISEPTVWRPLPKNRKPPTQTWRATLVLGQLLGMFWNLRSVKSISS